MNLSKGALGPYELQVKALSQRTLCMVEVRSWWITAEGNLYLGRGTTAGRPQTQDWSSTQMAAPKRDTSAAAPSSARLSGLPRTCSTDRRARRRSPARSPSSARVSRWLTSVTCAARRALEPGGGPITAAARAGRPAADA